MDQGHRADPSHLLWRRHRHGLQSGCVGTRGARLARGACVADIEPIIRAAPHSLAVAAHRCGPSTWQVRAVELPGHGSRAAEGVWPLGERDTTISEAISEIEGEIEGGDEALANSIHSAVSAQRAAAVSGLVDAIAHLCDGVHYALYGFSSGAMLAYLSVGTAHTVHASIRPCDALVQCAARADGARAL
jgi:hypothetical protein